MSKDIDIKMGKDILMTASMAQIVYSSIAVFI